MKRLTIFSMALTAIVISFAAVPIAFSASLVSGTVVDAEGEGIESALVTITSLEIVGRHRQFSAETWTNAEGNFEFESVPIGPCFLSAVSRGMGAARARVFVRAEITTSVTLQLPERRPHEEPERGSLVGVVLTADGRAVTNARVLIQPFRRPGHQRPRPGQMSTTTDASGNFSFESIPAGAWIVFVGSGRARMEKCGEVEIQTGMESSIEIILRH